MPEPPTESARLAAAAEVRDAMSSVGAQGQFWAKSGDWFFDTSLGSPAQIREVEVQPLPFTGDWDTPIEAVSFRKPGRTVDALAVIRRLVHVTAGYWIVFKTSKPFP
jgi:hypothetical protein